MNLTEPHCAKHYKHKKTPNNELAKSAELVADFLLANSDRKLTPMEVNKLVYISHGWMLALHDESLISEKIEAWKHGPVIPSLYHKFKMYGAEPIDALCTPLIDHKWIVVRIS